MAASQAGRPLVYVTYKDQTLLESFGKVYQYLIAQQATTKDLCAYLKRYSSIFNQSTLFEFITNTPIASLSKN